jgi:probable F420-dependent oxidoreductase
MHALVARAEELGYHAVTIGHHHFQLGYPSDPLTLMAAVAARTSTIRVGTGIFQLPFHHPLRVAEQVATIDELSGGRVTLGVGSGWWPLEYAAYGADIRERGARMEEALQVLRLVWTSESTSWDGRYWPFPELTVYPRPVQQPHPPIHVAGSAPVSIDRAARLGDGWLCSPTETFAAVVRWSGVYTAARERLGRPADWVLRRYAWVAPDRRHVEEDILPRYVDGLVAHWRESVEDPENRAMVARLDRGEAVPPREIADDRLLWGAPDDVIAQIERYRAATGCDHVHAAFGMGLPADTQFSYFGDFDALLAMVDLFGREVVPAFAAG